MPSEQIQTIIRLSDDVYKALETRVTAMLPAIPTSDLQAGYALGVQAVLKELRIGYVVS